MKKIFYLLFSVLFFISCGNKKSEQSDFIDGNYVHLSYAKNFTIQDFDHYQEIRVLNSLQDNKLFVKYYLVRDENTEVSSDGVKVKIPLKDVAVASVTHLEFLSLLGEIESITGICNPNLVYNKTVQQNFVEGIITDLGDSFSINVEKTIVLRPNALMMSGHSGTDANAERIRRAGIPLIYNNEWMESSLLGRAEWIKFVAAFFDKIEQADSIFSEIEYRYNEMKLKAQQVEKKPSIMAGYNFRGTWYMPAGRNFMNQLFQDAGGTYFYANDSSSGSLPLSLEMVLKNFADTDVWLNCNYSSMAELIKADSKHALFHPVKDGRVYNFNKRYLESTANDFWESAVARPDLLLGDVIAILHPEVLPDWKLVYASPLTP